MDGPASQYILAHKLYHNRTASVTHAYTITSFNKYKILIVN
jgi:hypothetical protein